MLVLADALIQAPDRILRPGRMRIVGRTILDLGTDLQPQIGEETLELPGHILAPGFINLHAHLELAPLHGAIPPGLPFSDWLARFLSLRPGLHATARTVSILESSRRAAETGTTSILNILSTPEALAGLAGTIPRIWWAREFMDLREDPGPEQAMDRMAAWLTRHPGADWKPALSPHAPYTASPALIRQCARLATVLHAPFTIHWAESAEEEEWLRFGTGSLHPLLPRGGLPDQRPESFAALPNGCLLAHGNRMTEAEWVGLGSRGGWVIHCPTTHAWFGREPFPLESLRKHRIPVGLGTDSPACSDNLGLDLRVEARKFRSNHPQVSWKELWSMLTIEPARALGQEGRLGALQPGASADWVGWKMEASGDPVISILTDSPPAGIVSVGGRLHRPERI